MKLFIRNYLSPYLPLLKIILLGIFLFTLYRLAFIFFNSESIPVIAENKLYYYSRAFLYGLNFDLVIISYLISPFVIFIFLTQLLNKNFKKGITFFKWYFIVTLTICLLICSADIPFYKQFGNHFNKEFALWMDSPGFVFKLIFSSVMYWGFMLLFIFFAIIIFRYVKKALRSANENTLRSNKLIVTVVFLVLTLFTVIGMRGRTGAKTPIQVGTAFFSEYYFINQLGLNPCFVFMKSILKEGKEWDFLKEKINDEELHTTISDLATTKKYTMGSGIEREYTFDGNPNKYNVMVVLMESMAITKMGYYGMPHLTSQFDSIAKHGVFFNHFYSAGIHTFNGVFSTQTGFPAVMDVHSLNTYTQKSFNGLSSCLKENGYTNYFFTSHDPQFDNLEGFMKFNKYDKVYSQLDYPSDKAISTMGVPDHYLLNYALQRMDEHVKTKHTPFFSFILTSTDHGPWEIPTDIPFKPTAEDKKDRATQYADWSLGCFIDSAKKYDWFNNTLFVFVADHGLNLGHTYAMPLSYNHIPCVFYMPSQLKPDTIPSLGGQIDVFPTIMSYLKIPYKNTSMGIDLFHEQRPCMYFTADTKIGCINNEYYYIHLFDEQKELLYKFKNLDTHNYLDEQKEVGDSLKKYSLKMIQTANQILEKKKY